MSLVDRWSRPAGYREVLMLAIPAVLSTSSWSIQNFVDRMFLSWYSPDAMAAALPSGMFAFSLLSFFLGTTSYATTFVAQYYGADQKSRIGPAVWQAIYFSLLAGLLLPLVALLAHPIFDLVGHEPKVRELEVSYFRIMMLGAVFSLYSGAISCFYTGLGRNWPVMWVNVIITLANVILDYAWIFGKWGFPERGIEGAALATITAQAIGALVFTVLVLMPRNEHVYAIRSGWRIDRKMFKRLMRFGAPSGLQFTLDMLAFTFFIFIVGRIGTLELAATNVALQINTLAFMPMIGFGIATSTLVGQWLGRNKPALAARATWSSFHLTFAYMTSIALLYVIWPDLFIDPFAAKSDPASFDAVRRMAKMMLYFVAIYCIFDTMNIIFASAIKGAGDTKFVMIMSMGLAWSIMVLPTWLLCGVGHAGIYTAWTFLSLYVVIVGFGFLGRFLQGKWRSMRVIEMHPVGAMPVKIPETPTSELDMDL